MEYLATPKNRMIFSIRALHVLWNQVAVPAFWGNSGSKGEYYGRLAYWSEVLLSVLTHRTTCKYGIALSQHSESATKVEEVWSARAREWVCAKNKACVFGTVPRFLYGTYKKIYINNRKKIKKKNRTKRIDLYIKNTHTKKKQYKSDTPAGIRGSAAIALKETIKMH